MSKYGTVEFQGKTLTLTQQAFCSNRVSDVQTYEAHAVDADGNDYRVVWDCVDGWMEMEDESMACDWDRYEVTAL